MLITSKRLPRGSNVQEPGRHRRASPGFTLIEILIVLVILGIISAIVIPQFTNATEDAKETAAHSQLNILRGQVTLYFARHGTIDPLGDDVPTMVETLSEDGLLSSVPIDLNTTERGFQVPAGYTIVWDPSIWSLDAFDADGSASGW